MTMSDLDVMNSAVGASTPAPAAVPSDKELAARDLQERREAAGVEAYRSSIDAACEKISEHYTNTVDAFRACAADLKASHDELFSSWSALRAARATYAQALEQRNNANPDERRVGPGGPSPLLFSEVQEQVLAFRAKSAANVACTAIAQAGEAVRVTASSRVK